MTYKKSLIKSHSKITHKMTYKKSLMKNHSKNHQKNQIPFKNHQKNQIKPIRKLIICYQKSFIYTQLLTKKSLRKVQIFGSKKSHSQKSRFWVEKKSHSNVTQKSKFGRPPPQVHILGQVSDVIHLSPLTV